MAPDNTPLNSPDFAQPPAKRRSREISRWREHSRSVRFWRKALPIVIASIAGLLVVWIGGRSVISLITSNAGRSEAGGVRMVNPRFYGRDTSNRAFVLGAKEASRDLQNGRTVTLTGPSVTLDAEGSAPTRVQADKGVFREDQKKVMLEGEVKVENAGGFNFSTPRAVVDTTTGVVTGDSGVRGDGPLGQIAASSYGVYDRGGRIVMKGDVRARIVQ